MFKSLTAALVLLITPLLPALAADLHHFQIEPAQAQAKKEFIVKVTAQDIDNKVVNTNQEIELTADWISGKEEKGLKKNVELKNGRADIALTVELSGPCILKVSDMKPTNDIFTTSFVMVAK